MTSRLALCATVAATVLFATGVGALAQTYEVTKLVPGSAFHGVHGLGIDKAGRLFAGSVAGAALYEVDRVPAIAVVGQDEAGAERAHADRQRDVVQRPGRSAHEALASLEAVRPGEVMIATQNIDDLHERAGSRAVIHMHGELLKARCTACGKTTVWYDDLTGNEGCPTCAIEGQLRPHVVWFGEMPLRLDAIYQVLAECKVFISIGTSGSVEPAASFVEEARRAGARTVELNLEPSQSASLFAERIYGPAGKIVPEFVASLLKGH